MSGCWSGMTEHSQMYCSSACALQRRKQIHVPPPILWCCFCFAVYVCWDAQAAAALGRQTVEAWCEFRVLDQAPPGLPFRLAGGPFKWKFDTAPADHAGIRFFLPRSELRRQDRGYLLDDRLVVSVDLRVES